MRSFFLPAILFLNSLKFSQKITFATAIFMLPILVFLSISGSKVYDEYENSNKLRTALVYTDALKAFYMEIPRHRGMMNARLYGDRIFDTRIEEIRAKIAGEIEVISSLTDRYGDDFGTREQWQNVKRRWESRLPELYDLSAAESFAFHTKLVEDTSRLIMTIGEYFRMSMSAVDLIDFHMMKILSQDIPYITEYAGRIRGIGAGIAAKKEMTGIEKQELYTLSSMIRAWQNILFHDLESIDMRIYKLSESTHKHDDTQLHIEFSTDFKKIIESIDAFLMLLERSIISSDGIIIDSASFFDEASIVIDANFNLYDNISSELATHIQSHYNEFIKKIIVAIAVLLLLLLLLFYFNTAFYISFMESLDKLKNGAEKVGLGNYGYLIDIQTKDELLLLSDSFNTMSKDLLKHNTFLNSYKSAIDKSAIITITDPNGTIIHANDRFYDITGFSRDEVIGHTHDIIKAPQTPQEECDEQWQTISQKHIWHGIMRNIKKNGDPFYADTTIVPIVDEKGGIAEFITIRKDVTELMKNREALINQLYTDSLTGLHNRRKLIENIKELGSCYLILLNINRYREVNDYYGHSTGDEILMALKRRLLEFAKPINASVYRLHADEFALLLSQESLPNSLEKTLEVLYTALTKGVYSVKSGDFGLDMTLSAAIKTQGDDAEVSDILINADLALRSARKKKKDFMIFDASISLKTEFENNLKWTRKLKDAIREDRIVPYFQPIINNETKVIEKYECLMRMIETDGTVISPMTFMQTAKKAKLYTKLTEIMVKKSIEAFKESHYEFSINLSADDILDKTTAEFIKESISNAPSAHRIVFEIVESEGIENFEEVRDFLHFAKVAGCKIAIDDFGTGYSNFDYLLKLNIDIIKLDGSLIKNINADKEAQRVVETIIDFAHKLGMQTVAEFVHSKEVLDKIEEMQIGYSQGYYFSEPKSHIA